MGSEGLLLPIISNLQFKEQKKMNKGGAYGGFIMCHLKKGTSKRYKADGAEIKASKENAFIKSPMVYIKSPIAKYFGFEKVLPDDALKMRTKQIKTKINGKEHTVTRMVSMGSTGASRSITVKFRKLTKIGGKDLASVKVTMPSSHTFANMVQEIMTKTDVVGNIASIVSPSGKSMTFGTPYNPKRKVEPT
jgi:hypothetical protein